jgi:hypothetical protein
MVCTLKHGPQGQVRVISSYDSNVSMIHARTECGEYRHFCRY